MTEKTDLWQMERELMEQGAEIICGCDEAGAGPLAGPVYAAAVILPPYCQIQGLDDSKNSRRGSGRPCMKSLPKGLSAGLWRGWKRRRSTPRIF